MPPLNSPYLVMDTFPKASTVTLDIPNTPNLFPTFHTSHVKPFKKNDSTKYPSRSLAKPGPIVVDGTPEHFIQKIINKKKISHNNVKYLVWWVGYSPEDDQWISVHDLDNNEALDLYLKDLG